MPNTADSPCPKRSFCAPFFLMQRTSSSPTTTELSTSLAPRCPVQSRYTRAPCNHPVEWHLLSSSVPFFLRSMQCTVGELGRFSAGFAEHLQCPTATGKESNVRSCDSCRQTSPESQYRLFARLAVVTLSHRFFLWVWQDLRVWCSPPCYTFVLSRKRVGPPFHRAGFQHVVADVSIKCRQLQRLSNENRRS